MPISKREFKRGKLATMGVLVANYSRTNTSDVGYVILHHDDCFVETLKIRDVKELELWKHRFNKT